MALFYENKKIQGVYLGTQNTNCLTYIPNDINLELDPLNVSVTGSPSVDNGVVSGFSSANYIATNSNFNPGSKTWEWQFKINRPSIANALIFGGKSYKIPMIGTSGSKFRLYLSGNGTSWSITSGTSGTHTVVADTDYWVRLRFTGSAYILSYSTDGSTFTDDITVSSTVQQVGGVPVYMGYGWNDTPMTNGSIDLSACYIKVGDNVVWQGGTGTLILKAGSKVYVPNGWTEQTETTVTETEYECFKASNGYYAYLKVPYKVEDMVYLEGETGSQTPSSSSSELQQSALMFVHSINSDGSVLIAFLGGGNTYTRYPAGDLTKTTTTIVGSGDRVFDEIVVSDDISKAVSSSNIYDSLIFYNASGDIGYEDISVVSSGSTTPTEGIFYNTDNNAIKYYSSSTAGSDKYSLPIAIVSVNGKVGFTEIKHSFNGFGYIGNTLFTTLGIKGLIANGVNKDLTYKSTEFTTTKIQVSNVDITTTNPIYLLLDNNLLDYCSVDNVKFNSNENLLYVNDVAYQGVIAGEFVFEDGKITSLTPKPVQPEKTGREISHIYKGSSLVYGYKQNQVLLEESTAGTYALNIKYGGYYEVTIVGGGGGGAYNVSTKFSDGVISGGSGAGFQGIIHLKAGTYIVKVGAGGESVNPRNASTAMPKVGSDSSIANIITAGCANADGTANAGFGGSNNVISKGGVLTYDSDAIRSYTIATNGNDGLQGWNTSVEGASSVISGTTYGAGDKGQNGAMSKGQDGYVKIVAI